MSLFGDGLDAAVQKAFTRPAPKSAPAQRAGASDAQLQQIAADALREVHFQDGGRRAGQLEEVRFTDIEHLPGQRAWQAGRSGEAEHDGSQPSGPRPYPTELSFPRPPTRAETASGSPRPRVRGHR